MKRLFKPLGLMLTGAMILFSCSENEIATDDLSVPDEVAAQIAALGFNVDDFAPIKFDEGYLVEGDIYLPAASLEEMQLGRELPSVEHYSTDNLVLTGGSRNITMYARQGGWRGYSPAMIAGLDEAIARYNALGLEITFSRVSSSSQADIVMTRLNWFTERRGVLGSAGFPTASGDPYDEIQMSGILESTYGLGVDEIATIIAHEMGHCIGFRHTDFFDRSISCGGGTSNEGNGGVGANYIPGTPTGASLADASWMLACTDGSDRPFNSNDLVALDYLY